MLAIFEDLNSNGLYLSSQKQRENRCLVFTSSIKREIRKFHVVVVQWREKNIQKSVIVVLPISTYRFFAVLVDVVVVVA